MEGPTTGRTATFDADQLADLLLAVATPTTGAAPWETLAETCDLAASMAAGMVPLAGPSEALEMLLPLVREAVERGRRCDAGASLLTKIVAAQGDVIENLREELAVERAARESLVRERADAARELEVLREQLEEVGRQEEELAEAEAEIDRLRWAFGGGEPSRGPA